MPWCKQSSALRRFGTVNHRLRLPSTGATRDLPLRKPAKRAILASKPPEIWRISAKGNDL
jgi:hypothetical protein